MKTAEAKIDAAGEIPNLYSYKIKGTQYYEYAEGKWSMIAIAFINSFSCLEYQNTFQEGPVRLSKNGKDPSALSALPV